MNFINNIKERAKKDKKTIVLPESMDLRVVQAAEKIINEDFTIPNFLEYKTNKKNVN